MSLSHPENSTQSSTTTTLTTDHLDVDKEKLQLDEDHSEYDPPDGGIHAWLTVLGGTLVAFATFGFVNGFGVFVDYYKKDYLSTYSPTLITMIGAVQVFVMYTMAGFAGAVFDAIGPRLLIPTSGVVVVLSLFLLSITKPQQIWQQFLTQAVLFNLGASFGFFPAISVISHWFQRRMAFGIGCVAAGASVGGIVFPIMLERLIPRIGFGWTVRCTAFVNLFCYIVASLTIRRRRPKKKIPPFSQLLDFAAFKDPCYLALAIGAWFSIFSIFNPFFYIALYNTVAFGRSNITPYAVAIMCATSIVGRVGPGFVADRLGRFNVLSLTTLVSSILILALWYNTSSEAVSMTFAGLYGFTSGPFFTLLPACIAQISPVEKVGARVGIMFGFMSFGALAGTPIGGVFIKTQTVENFRHLILFSGLMGLIGSFFIFVARFVKDRRLSAIL